MEHLLKAAAMSKKERPHLQGETSDLRIRVRIEQRQALELLATGRGKYISHIVRDALTHYLALPHIQTEIQTLSKATNPTN
jgi:predicted DNA-binding protein